MTDTDKRPDHPPSWASLYGDQAADINQFGDLGPSQHPDDRSSAVRHARNRQRRDLEAATRRDLDLIERVAEHDADDQALAEASRLVRDSKEVPPALRARAARAARRKGQAPSSAQQLADRYRRGRRPSGDAA